MQVFISSVGFGASSIDVHWGIAKNDFGDVVYTEKHTVTRENGVTKRSETIYYDKTRNTKIATLISDYSKSISLPTYEFVDLRTGYREGLRFTGGTYVVYYKRPDEAEKSKVLSQEDGVFSCQGWHYYLIDNLAVLEKRDIALKLVLPSELDFYSFKIEKVKSTGDQVVANLELSNWLLSFFAPKLKLVYDKKERKLIGYKGISNILDKEGERQEVSIAYAYEH